MARITISEGELLEALVAAAPVGTQGPADARTVEEMSATTGLKAGVIRQRLKVLQAEGRLTAYRVTRPSIDGRHMSVPAYTIAPPKKAKR